MLPICKSKLFFSNKQIFACVKQKSCNFAAIFTVDIWLIEIRYESKLCKRYTSMIYRKGAV